ncbi:MAG: hypothetical protein MJZ76_07940 [Bacteroidales bacterium]|nr:hypothetical protein [Bacteroidales bacterium]
MNNKRETYSHLSSLEEIAAEKKILRKRISRSEKKIDEDWGKIRSAWDFAAKIKKGLGFFTNATPFGLGIASVLVKLFSKNK